jgi:uncharacterized protein YbaR (Trm112 family)
LLITCPTCGSGLQVPDGTTAMVRCPACKNVFPAGMPPLPPEPRQDQTAEKDFPAGVPPLPPEPGEEETRQEQPEESEVKQKSITCPTCMSTLQVPEDTTAMIRCPACKSVFSAEQGPSIHEPEEEEEPKKKTKPRNAKRARKTRDEEESEKKTSAKKSMKAALPENRDFDPDAPKKKTKKRRNFEEEEMSPDERAALKAAFIRAAWGAKLVWLSILLFMLSMLLIIAYFFQATFNYSNPAGLYAAGMMGILNWVLGAIGVGLCLSGPPSKGHWGYGISAAIATGIHMLLVLSLVASSKEYVEAHKNISESEKGAVRWEVVTTRLDMITFYPTYLIFGGEQDIVPNAYGGLGVACGVMELIRIVLIMMLLSCLAEAAGDKDLSGYCTRAGGTACLSPGALSIFVLFYASFVIVAKADGLFFRIVFMSLFMGIYAILAGFMLRALMASREVIDVLEEPYQSQQPML